MKTVRRIFGWLLWLGSTLGLFVVWHLYLWARLVRDVALPSPAATVVTITLFALALSLPVSALARRLLPRPIAYPLRTVAYAWLAGGILLVSLLLIGDAIRLFDYWILASTLGLGLPRWIAVVAAALAGAGVVFGVREAVRVARVRPVTVKLPRLSTQMDGTTIVQLTDMHLGPTLKGKFAASIVEAVNALQPDIVAITGDLVDGGVDALRDVVAPLGQLRARYGVYFVTGNHEYYTGETEQWVEHLGELGIRTLRNERVVIGGEADGFDLAGVDDLSSQGSDLGKALADRDTARELVLLAHQPQQVFEAADAGVGLQLSGHTHGGQFWPFMILVRMMHPFLAGLNQVKDTLLYVSRGVGFWGPPIRLAAPAEITHVTLRATRIS